MPKMCWNPAIIAKPTIPRNFTADNIRSSFKKGNNIFSRNNIFFAFK